MTDLRVVALIPAKSGSEDVLRAALTTLAEASRGHAGCTGYDLFESGAAAGTFVTVESWSSQAELDAHLQTADVAAALAAADAHLAGDVVIHPLQPVG
ncbi:antibiotic biosynthesis monooxygenase [Nocardioides panacis]|uniref:Antibiotic biosynthesis monooxygenase n=1 Tax=Nocardioides panacis TaxID=2849501 RepID=A0A975T1B5_9ACTN|nr:putative quinol monooxygenase [Nocardioides panacis]QWZ09805.1 antibiotic biosynthesis monooxygenase [Nocardioides panacis]